MIAVRRGCNLALAVVALASAHLGAPRPAASQTQPGLDCNLFGPDEPCDPSLLYPPAQDLRLIIRSRYLDPEGREKSAPKRIDTLRDLFAALQTCWIPPAIDQARLGMELTVRLSFNKAGGIIGQPRFTYVNRAAKPAEQDLYRRNVLDTIARCTPLPFTPGMGGAVAGRPITIRFIEDRRPRGLAETRAQQRTTS